jgi:hypothetical protein
MDYKRVLRLHYSYISNAISTYASPGKEKIDHMTMSLKPADGTVTVTGVYKDDDSQYSLDNLLRKQEGGDFQ